MKLELTNQERALLLEAIETWIDANHVDAPKDKLSEVIALKIKLKGAY
jgi:hypothetical protein